MGLANWHSGREPIHSAAVLAALADSQPKPNVPARTVSIFAPRARWGVGITTFVGA
jgi:hypothetical protein